MAKKDRRNETPHPRPTKGDPWETATLTNLRAAEARGDSVLVAHWDGWRPMKVETLKPSEDGKRIKMLMVKTEHGGIMEVPPSVIGLSVLVRVPPPGAF